jgi:hypothetical protein
MLLESRGNTNGFPRIHPFVSIVPDDLFPRFLHLEALDAVHDKINLVALVEPFENEIVIMDLLQDVEIRLDTGYGVDPKRLAHEFLE